MRIHDVDQWQTTLPLHNTTMMSARINFSPISNSLFLCFCLRSTLVRLRVSEHDWFQIGWKKTWHETELCIGRCQCCEFVGINSMVICYIVIDSIATATVSVLKYSSSSLMEASWLLPYICISKIRSFIFSKASTSRRFVDRRLRMQSLDVCLATKPSWKVCWATVKSQIGIITFPDWASVLAQWVGIVWSTYLVNVMHGQARVWCYAYSPHYKLQFRWPYIYRYDNPET